MAAASGKISGKNNSLSIRFIHRRHLAVRCCCAYTVGEKALGFEFT